MARQPKNWIQKNFKLEIGIEKKLRQLHDHFNGRFSEVFIVETAIDSYAQPCVAPAARLRIGAVMH